MQDPPPPASILEAVAAFLRDAAAPVLPPRAAFEARVAANALDIARRTLSAGPAEEAERARLAALLGREGTLDDLTRALCAALEAGEMDLFTPGLADHLLTTTREKVAVDQPGFGPFRRLPPED